MLGSGRNKKDYRYALRCCEAKGPSCCSSRPRVDHPTGGQQHSAMQTQHTMLSVQQTTHDMSQRPIRACFFFKQYTLHRCPRVTPCKTVHHSQRHNPLQGPSPPAQLACAPQGGATTFSCLGGQHPTPHGTQLGQINTQQVPTADRPTPSTEATAPEHESQGHSTTALPILMPTDDPAVPAGQSTDPSHNCRLSSPTPLHGCPAAC
jgi:hypothetical protein